MPMLVSAGSASTQATSPWASSRSSAATSLNSTTRVVSAAGTDGPTRALAGDDARRRRQRGERLVDGAVVAPVEHEDLRPPGDRAGDPQREAVGVRRGQRELPVGQPEAPRQLLADPQRVLARQHQRDAARRLRRDRAQRRLGRVAGHRAGVAEAEVDVLVPVDVGEARALRPRPRTPGSRRASAPSSASARRRAASASPARRARGSAGARRGSARARGPSVHRAP